MNVTHLRERRVSRRQIYILDGCRLHNVWKKAWRKSGDMCCIETRSWVLVFLNTLQESIPVLFCLENVVKLLQPKMLVAHEKRDWSQVALMSWSKIDAWNKWKTESKENIVQPLYQWLKQKIGKSCYDVFQSWFRSSLHQSWRWNKLRNLKITCRHLILDIVLNRG